MDLFYYQVGVTGKESFSCGVTSEVALDDDEVVLKAYEDDKMHGDDCHHVSYVEELTEEEYNDLYN